jgi:predicted component of type VI protein secretion system
MGPSFRIVMRSGPTPGKAFPLEKAETFIGRDLSNDVVINDPEISRRHSRIFFQNGTYFLEDLGSTNGTSVNGQRLIGPYSVRPGEVITLGERITFVFEALQTAGDATLNAGGAQSDQPAQSVPSPSPSSFSAPFNPASYEIAGNPQVRPSAPVVAPPSPQQPPRVQPYQAAPSAPPPYQPAQPVYPNPYQNPQPVSPNSYPSAAPQAAYPPAAPPQYQQVPQAPPLAYEPDQSPFTGQVPLNAEAEPVDQPARAPIWPYIVIGVLLLIILVLVIDDFHLWCLILGGACK